MTSYRGESAESSLTPECEECQECLKLRLTVGKGCSQIKLSLRGMSGRSLLLLNSHIIINTDSQADYSRLYESLED